MSEVIKMHVREVIQTGGGGGKKPLELTASFANNNSASAAGEIVLTSNDATKDGSYDIMWGDANGVMSNYSKIDTLAVSSATNKPSATIKLNAFNAIPKYATKICAVQNNTVICDYDIPASKLWDAQTFGEHLYSFGALSDVHVQYQTGHDDVHVAMTYLNERESVDAICISGDLTMYGTLEHLEAWKTDRDTWSDNTPVYACNGNHEAYADSALMVTAPTTIRPYLDSDFNEETGTPYFYKDINNDVFVFVATYEGTTQTQGHVMFSENCLAWLENLLETYRNQRVFLFCHVPPHSKHTQYNGFGIGNMAYSYDLWGYGSNSNRDTFLSLLDHYKNVIWFSGHSHIKYEYQKLWEDLNICKYKNGAKFVHISSLTVPRDIVDGSTTDYQYAESEGAVVDVYANAIRVRNRNFVGEKFIGLCEYLIDTTPVTIPPATKTVVSITATKTKTAYYTDETLSTADITVTATYSDTSTDDVSSEAVYNTSAVTLSTAGTYTIGVSYTYGGDTVTTTVQVTSEARPEAYTVMLDATFDGEIATKGSSVANIIANNNTTHISGALAECHNSAILNKPLYYRLLSDTGLSVADSVGFRGGASTSSISSTIRFTDYSLDATDWQPLMQDADPTAQISVESPNDRVWVQCRSSSISTATFPVAVNSRIQIGYLSE